jgi:hypothetical protein
MAEESYRCIDGSDRLLTQQEVAEILRMTLSWVRDHTTRYDPRLPGIRMGGKWVYKASRIEKFIDDLLTKTSHAA